MINIALPKGRLGEKVYSLLAATGYACEDFSDDSRKLVFTDKNRTVRYFWVKPSDVGVYVELGAADIGVIGKDILNEYQPDVYELADLKLGKCSMCVAAKNDWRDNPSMPLRVATKFTNTAERYFMSEGRDIELIKLNGSVELAPVLGISDVIVDIVETGTTLKENNLTVFKKIADVSARLISNKSSLKFKNKEIKALTEKIGRAIEEND